jgi:hypothetical protein
MSMIIDGTNGLTFNNATTQASAGCVLQVVNTFTQTAQTLATATYTDLTGLSLTITPKFATSKILVTWTVEGGFPASNSGFSINLVRNGTTIVSNGGSYDVYLGSSAGNMMVSKQYLDSPASTSALTYKLQASCYGGRTVNFQDSSAYQSMITIMEIAG